MGRYQVVWVPRADAPPVGLSLRQVAEDTGWTEIALYNAIRKGQLPAPDVFNGRMWFPAWYSLYVLGTGPSPEGTFHTVRAIMRADAEQPKAARRRKAVRK